MMKREREVDSMMMANYLMLLSRGGDFQATYTSLSNNYSTRRVFECKTCNRQFPSFQALGGHRASHKKPRLMLGDDIHGGDDDNNNNNNMMDSQLLLHHGSSPKKPKTHECSICGLEFAIGQALGGHMRRHRAENLNGSLNNNNNSTTMSHNSSSLDSSSKKVVKAARNKRVLVLDLNLTPFENDLEFLKIGKATAAFVDYL